MKKKIPDYAAGKKQLVAGLTVFSSRCGRLTTAFTGLRDDKLPGEVVREQPR